DCRIRLRTLPRADPGPPQRHARLRSSGELVDHLLHDGDRGHQTPLVHRSPLRAGPDKVLHLCYVQWGAGPRQAVDLPRGCTHSCVEGAGPVRVCEYQGDVAVLDLPSNNMAAALRRANGERTDIDVR